MPASTASTAAASPIASAWLAAELAAACATVTRRSWAPSSWSSGPSTPDSAVPSSVVARTSRARVVPAAPRSWPNRVANRAFPAAARTRNRASAGDSLTVSLAAVAANWFRCVATSRKIAGDGSKRYSCIASRWCQKVAPSVVLRTAS